MPESEIIDVPSPDAQEGPDKAKIDDERISVLVKKFADAFLDRGKGGTAAEII